MARFEDIIGHEPAVQFLKKSVEEGKISHAYIIQGEPGIGKRMLAETFAQALVCERTSARPCGICRSCHQAMNHNHPDIIYVTHENPTQIKIDEIRHQVVSNVVIRPYGDYKI